MTIVDDLCHKCSNLDVGDYECKAGQFIRGITEHQVVAECEDFKENESEN